MPAVLQRSATNFLVIANVLVWLVGFTTGWTEPMQIEGGFWSARLHDALYGHSSALPVDYPWVVPVWLTPFTSAFLHAGLFHLAMNMLALIVIGRIVEMALGWERYLLLYGAGMIAAAAMHYAIDPVSMVPVAGRTAAAAVVVVLAAAAVVVATTP